MDLLGDQNNQDGREALQAAIQEVVTAQVETDAQSK